MALVMPALEHLHFELRLALCAELHLEQLSLLVGDDIERVIRAAQPSWQVLWSDDAKPRAHADELIRDRFRIHTLDLEFGIWAARVAEPASGRNAYGRGPIE
jgi:hypothetical protein